jgi:hypothetical protein
MTNKHIMAGLSLLILCGLILAACSKGTPKVNQPTPDPNLILTQAAQTVAAGITQTAAAQPTATYTLTVEPTSTMDAAMAAGLTATANAVLQVPTQPAAGATPLASPTVGLATTPVVIPTATGRAVVSTAPAPASPDKCEWVANSPADNSELKQNASYDATIVVKNTGTSTWDNTVVLRFFGGERMGIPKDYNVQGEVKPGELYKFIFTIVMPDSTGDKQALLVVQNSEAVNMCFINLPYKVVKP